MNERIKELAEQAKFAMNVSNDPNSLPSWWAAGHNDTFEKFAALVAAAEREACAKVAERWPHEDERMFSIAQAIRARGNK